MAPSLLTNYPSQFLFWHESFTIHVEDTMHYTGSRTICHCLIRDPALYAQHTAMFWHAGDPVQLLLDQEHFWIMLYNST
eukprot:2305989-Rhodomonas_salina.1